MTAPRLLGAVLLPVSYLDSRSAALHRAVRLLHSAELGGTYEAAWGEWAAEDDGAVWDSTIGDGLKR